MYHNSIAINANDVNNFSGIIVSLSKPIAEMELPLSEDAKLILALMLERGLVE
jgi:hypothetical protein